MSKVWCFIKCNFFFVLSGLYFLGMFAHAGGESVDIMQSLESLLLCIILLVAGFMDRGNKKASEVLSEQSDKLKIEIDKLKLMAKKLKEKKSSAPADEGLSDEEAPVKK